MNRTCVVTTTFILAACAIAAAAVRPALFSQDMPQPGEQHKQVLRGVGEWQGTLTTFTPDGAAESVAATQITEAVGGFWTQSRFTCKFMGMDYIGTGVNGYDETRKKYVGTWVDNMSSYLAVMEGEMDAKGEKCTMHWMAPDMTGAIVPHRAVTTESKDSYTSTFFQGEGEGTKSMVIEMKRKPKAVAK